MDLKQLINDAWSNRDLLKDTTYTDAVRSVIEEVDKGRLRTAEPTETGWQVKRMGEAGNPVILWYSADANMGCCSFEFYDKMLLKKKL